MESIILALGALLIALVVCVMGGIALLKQKVVVDQEGHVTEVEIPILGKLKTNYPSLVAIFIGVGLVAFVWHKWTIEPEQMPFVAKILVEHPSATARKEVFVGAIPQKYHVFQNGVEPNKPSEVRVMLNKGQAYQAFAYTVSEIDANGFAHKVAEHGLVKIIGDYERAEFEAILRMER